MAIRRLTSTAVLLALLAAVGGCGAQRDRVSPLVPTTWTMTASSGHLATLCFGSWEECGTLHRSYATHSEARPAITALTHRLRDAGWTIEKETGGQVVAFDAPTLHAETARLDADITEGQASLRYVHE